MADRVSAGQDRITRAAELRAGGASWEMVAEQLGRAVDTVKRWPTLHPALWRKATRAAERQLLREATAESVHTLRRQLRSDDEKSSRDAAQKLISYRVAVGKRPASKRRGKPRPQTELTQIAAYLESLPDEQVQSLFTRWLEEGVRARLAANQGASPPSNPVSE